LPVLVGDALEDEADAVHLVALMQEHLLLGPGFLAGAFHPDATVGRASVTPAAPMGARSRALVWCIGPRS
jgi:hypothetical protein